MSAALTARGFTVLRDARTQIRVRGEPLDLIGIRYWTRRIDGSGAAGAGRIANAVLLAHTPKRLIEAAALSVPLLLSGHTHGGQIVLPGLGAVAARKFPVVAGVGPPRQHDDLRQSWCRHRLRPGSGELPARSRDPDGTFGPLTARL